jgi:hypothetical protein
VAVSSRWLPDLERSVVLDFIKPNRRKTFLRDECKTVNGFFKISHGQFSKKIFVDNFRQKFFKVIAAKSKSDFQIPDRSHFFRDDRCRLVIPAHHLRSGLPRSGGRGSLNPYSFSAPLCLCGKKDLLNIRD